MFKIHVLHSRMEMAERHIFVASLPEIGQPEIIKGKILERI